MKIYHLPVLLIFWGILSFGMSIYFSIVSVKYFVNLSLARDRAERMVSFNREGNKHIGIITVSSDDLYCFTAKIRIEVFLQKNFSNVLI